MKPQIVHEAEVHRQHVRLRIPIAVEIDGTRYAVDDWSMGGVGVASLITSRQPGERFPARLIFPLEDFEIALRLQRQMVYVEPDLPRYGCRFLALSQGQVSLFRYLVDAYLSGEIVSGGDVLAVAGRDNSADGRSHSPAFNPFLAEESVGRRWRRYAGYALVLAIGVGLAAFVGMGVQDRFLTVASDTAVIEAPLYRLKAPTAGACADPPPPPHRPPPGAAAPPPTQPDGILPRGEPGPRIPPNGGQPVTV